MSDRRLRVLHVFNRMDRGGAETWIVNVMRHIDRDRFRFDFLVESKLPGVFDAEIRSLGGELHHGGSPKRLARFAWALDRIVHKNGPYDVMHSHVHHSSGIMLALAAAEGIPARIAHSHSNIQPLLRDASLPRRLYYRGTRALVDRFATAGLAASRDAAESLFGAGWEGDPRWQVLHCGIDLRPFQEPINREAVRAGLGIDPEAFVVGHVGRFSPMKRHDFLVEVFGRVHRTRSDALLLLVGDGAGRREIERKVAALGLSEAVVFAGSQAAVPSILRGAMDVFVFPSEYEGLGLAVVEAQAAGLPCVISENIPGETAVVPDLVRRLPTGREPERWAATILKQCGAPNERRANAAIERVIESPFDLRASVEALERAYLDR